MKFAVQCVHVRVLQAVASHTIACIFYAAYMTVSSSTLIHARCCCSSVHALWLQVKMQAPYLVYDTLYIVYSVMATEAMCVGYCTI
jgi:hypothetical protein